MYACFRCLGNIFQLNTLLFQLLNVLKNSKETSEGHVIVKCTLATQNRFAMTIKKINRTILMKT